MPKILLHIKEGNIVEVTTEGMEIKKPSKLEKLRRIMTRNRSVKQMLRTLNAPIKYT